MSQQSNPDQKQLEEALEQFHQTPNAQTERDFAEALHAATLLMPVRGEMGAEGEGVQYVAVKSQEGEFFVPLFTSVGQRARWMDGPQRLMEVPGENLHTILPVMGKVAGLVINFASACPQVLTLRDLNRLAFLHRENKKQRALQSGQGYHFWPLITMPDALIATLSGCLAAYPMVRAAYFVGIDFDGLSKIADELPKDYILAIDCGNETLPPGLRQQVGEALAAVFSDGETVHIGNANILDDKMRQTFIPVYRR